mmetsp:Transcript_2373/g.10120  ORF Transcript_2373/g.10120 Transcript_2373/m.10120 type:complete len:222 (-) Transcript_2373:1229-1894(-)
MPTPEKASTTTPFSSARKDRKEGRERGREGGLLRLDFGTRRRGCSGSSHGHLDSLPVRLRVLLSFSGRLLLVHTSSQAWRAFRGGLPLREGSRWRGYHVVKVCQGRGHERLAVTLRAFGVVARRDLPLSRRCPFVTCTASFSTRRGAGLLPRARGRWILPAHGLHHEQRRQDRGQLRRILLLDPRQRRQHVQLRHPRKLGGRLRGQRCREELLFGLQGPRV